MARSAITLDTVVARGPTIHRCTSRRLTNGSKPSTSTLRRTEPRSSWSPPWRARQRMPRWPRHPQRHHRPSALFADVSADGRRYRGFALHSFSPPPFVPVTEVHKINLCLAIQTLVVNPVRVFPQELSKGVLCDGASILRLAHPFSFQRRICRGVTLRSVEIWSTVKMANPAISCTL